MFYQFYINSYSLIIIVANVFIQFRKQFENIFFFLFIYNIFFKLSLIHPDQLKFLSRTYIQILYYHIILIKVSQDYFSLLNYIMYCISLKQSLIEFNHMKAAYR